MTCSSVFAPRIFREIDEFLDSSFSRNRKTLQFNKAGGHTSRPGAAICHAFLKCAGLPPPGKGRPKVDGKWPSTFLTKVAKTQQNQHGREWVLVRTAIWDKHFRADHSGGNVRVKIRKKRETRKTENGTHVQRTVFLGPISTRNAEKPCKICVRLLRAGRGEVP